MPTLSSPNWESVIGGAAPEQHGITSNGYLRHMVEFQPVCRDSDGRFPTIFGALRAQLPESNVAVFHDWGGFSDLVEKHAPTVMRHTAGAGNTIEAALAYWRDFHPTLLFIHIDNVDHAGHDAGWATQPYYRAVEDADAYIGRVLDTLEALGQRESTYILLTSDHGGTRKGHGKNSLAEIQIPWMLEGPNVVPGKLAAPVNTFDSAATLAWIFGLETPACWIGRPVMAAFRAPEPNSKECGTVTRLTDVVLAHAKQ
jgi:hypothetical protein